MSQSQNARIIDIGRSYVPIDPNAFPNSMHATGGEDAPESRVPVIPYDGYNFMPTAHGYMSYFGTNSELGIDALAENVDDVFIVQTADLRNILVALCDDGIHTKDGGVSGAWEKIIALTVPDAGEHKNWTKVVIGNEIILYRAGEASVWVMNAANSYIPTALIPDTLTMSAQQGIFKAGGRLGFWDSDNSVAWSNPDDFSDFELSLKTGAGAAKFQPVQGKIVNILQHGNGFVIYATKSITTIIRTADAYQLWAAVSIFNNNGISYLNEACMGQPDTTHYAYTTFGMVKIENGKADYIIPEIYSYLKEKREPIYLRLIEGRFLFFQMINPEYILGNPGFSVEVVPETTITFPGASYAIDNITENVCKSLVAVNHQDKAYLYDTYGYTAYTEATGTGEVPIWRDNLASTISITDLSAWYAYKEAGGTGYQYFIDNGFTNGVIVAIDGNSETFLPTKLPQAAGTFVASLYQEDNTNAFFHKQEMLWQLEAEYIEDWKEAINRKSHLTYSSTGGTTFSSTQDDNSISVARTKYTFGPYILPTFLSEANRYYGIADKSAWLQRSLTEGINIEVFSSLHTSYSYETAQWTASPASVGPWASYAALVADSPNVVAIALAELAAGDPSGAPFALTSITENNAGGDFGGLRNYRWNWENKLGAPAGSWTAGIAGADYTLYGLASGTEVYVKTENTLQVFSRPEFTYTSYPTCTYKELGYTDISGHGHYTLLGAFVQDDAIAEAADYTDICLSSPDKKKQFLFNGNAVPTNQFLCGPTAVTIDEEEYSYADQTVVLPASSFLLQQGSIEPIYPNFAGAFVYDLQYKKWGKMSLFHKLLLDYSPINSHAGDGTIPSDIFNVTAGAFLADGKIKIFDKYPADSIIKYGKIGYYRKGFTDCDGVQLEFRDLATGSVTIEGSIDGKLIAPAISQISSYSNVMSHLAGFSSSARWYNVVISGYYDLKNITFLGHKKGKR